jgi:hypothetical protein
LPILASTNASEGLTILAYSLITAADSPPQSPVTAGVSAPLNNYLGATLTMIGRHYGHLARDGREHAISLLDQFTSS